jgi:hypothetical protein
VRYIVGLAMGLRVSHWIISGDSDPRKGGAMPLAGLRAEPVRFDLDIPYAATEDRGQWLDVLFLGGSRDVGQAPPTRMLEVVRVGVP